MSYYLNALLVKDLKFDNKSMANIWYPFIGVIKNTTGLMPIAISGDRFDKFVKSKAPNRVAIQRSNKSRHFRVRDMDLIDYHQDIESSIRKIHYKDEHTLRQYLNQMGVPVLDIDANSKEEAREQLKKQSLDQLGDADALEFVDLGKTENIAEDVMQYNRGDKSIEDLRYGYIELHDTGGLRAMDASWNLVYVRFPTMAYKTIGGLRDIIPPIGQWLTTHGYTEAMAFISDGSSMSSSYFCFIRRGNISYENSGKYCMTEVQKQYGVEINDIFDIIYENQAIASSKIDLKVMENRYRDIDRQAAPLIEKYFTQLEDGRFELKPNILDDYGHDKAAINRIVEIIQLWHDERQEYLRTQEMTTMIPPVITQHIYLESLNEQPARNQIL